MWWLKTWKARKGKKTILCLYLEAVLQPTDTQASCHCRASLWPLKEKKECFKFQLKWVLNCTGASACGNLRITIFHRAWSYSCISVWPIESLGMFPWQREGTVCKLVLNSWRVWGSIFSIWNWQNIVQSWPLEATIWIATKIPLLTFNTLCLYVSVLKLKSKTHTAWPVPSVYKLCMSLAHQFAISD